MPALLLAIVAAAGLAVVIGLLIARCIELATSVKSRLEMLHGMLVLIGVSPMKNNGVAAGAAPIEPVRSSPSASEFGLPWRLEDSEDGYEINATPVGWLFRIVLDDTIGDHPRDNDEPFRSAQREHADFIARACNSHHALVAALQLAEGHLAEMLLDPKWHPIGHCPVLDRVREALSLASTPTKSD